MHAHMYTSAMPFAHSHGTNLPTLTLQKCSDVRMLNGLCEGMLQNLAMMLGEVGDVLVCLAPWCYTVTLAGTSGSYRLTRKG